MKIEAGRKRKERIPIEEAPKGATKARKIACFVELHDSDTLKKEWRSQNGE
jgi:hypothetical protein